MTTEEQILAEIEKLEQKVSKAKEELRSAEWDLTFARKNLGAVRMNAIRKRRSENNLTGGG